MLRRIFESNQIKSALFQATWPIKTSRETVNKSNYYSLPYAMLFHWSFTEGVSVFNRRWSSTSWQRRKRARHFLRRAADSRRSRDCRPGRAVPGSCRTVRPVCQVVRRHRRRLLRLQLPAAGRRDGRGLGRHGGALSRPVLSAAAGRGDPAATGVSSSGTECDRPAFTAPAEPDRTLYLLPADVQRHRQRGRVVPPRSRPSVSRRRLSDVWDVCPADSGVLLRGGRSGGTGPPV